MLRAMQPWRSRHFKCTSDGRQMGVIWTSDGRQRPSLGMQGWHPLEILPAPPYRAGSANGSTHTAATVHYQRSLGYQWHYCPTPNSHVVTHHYIALHRVVLLGSVCDKIRDPFTTYPPYRVCYQAPPAPVACRYPVHPDLPLAQLRARMAHRHIAPHLNVRPDIRSHVKSAVVCQIVCQMGVLA